MKALLNSQIMFTVHMLIIALVIICAAWAVHSAKKESELKLLQNIDAHNEELLMLADMTDRNDAVDAISEIIVDCPSRVEFESLLAALDTLTHKNLMRVQQLFDSCGSFYSERKALMVARLDREYQVLKEYTDVLATLTDVEERKSILNDWGSLVEAEYSRSELLQEQVEIQQDIITTLITGAGLQSAQIKTSLSRANEVAQSLDVFNKQIDVLRTSLEK